MKQPDQISLEKDYEVRHWMRTLNCTQEELYTAVRRVGRGLDDLQRLRCTEGLSLPHLPAVCH
jgi:hypothetical protein